MIKLFPLVIFRFLLISCCENLSNNIEPDIAFYITKTEVGFNIYPNKGILTLEYFDQENNLEGRSL